MSPPPQLVSSCPLFTKGVGRIYKSLLKPDDVCQVALEKKKKKSPTFMIEMTKTKLVEGETLNIKRCS